MKDEKKNTYVLFLTTNRVGDSTIDQWTITIIIIIIIIIRRRRIRIRIRRRIRRRFLALLLNIKAKITLRDFPRETASKQTKTRNETEIFKTTKQKPFYYKSMLNFLLAFFSKSLPTCIRTYIYTQNTFTLQLSHKKPICFESNCYNNWRRTALKGL